MKEMSIYDPKGEENLAKELQERVKNPVFVCIGTEKVFADSLGPRVGSLLNAQMSKPYFVYGLCNQNITAENLVYCHDFIKKMHPQSQLVVVDAAVGTTEQIGKIQISQGGNCSRRRYKQKFAVNWRHQHSGHCRRAWNGRFLHAEHFQGKTCKSGGAVYCKFHNAGKYLLKKTVFKTVSSVLYYTFYTF